MRICCEFDASRQPSDDFVPGCSADFLKNISQKLLELMSVYLAKHPEDQSKLIDENAQFLGDKNNAGV